MNSPELFSSFLQMITGLALVLSLLFFVLYLAKLYIKKKGGVLGGESLIKILGTTYIGPKKGIAVIEVGGEILVVSITSNEINMLCKIDSPEIISRLKEERYSEKRRFGLFPRLGVEDSLTAVAGSIQEKVDLLSRKKTKWR